MKMTDKEKIEKALVRIDKEGLISYHATPNDMLEALVNDNMGIRDIADMLSQIINLVGDLRDILEEE